jgi:hypothetical protein
VTTDQAPVCARHEDDVAMSLLTFHSDESSPDQLLGRFECPMCGHESWQPFVTARPEAS